MVLRFASVGEILICDHCNKKCQSLALSRDDSFSVSYLVFSSFPYQFYAHFFLGASGLFP